MILNINHHLTTFCCQVEFDTPKNLLSKDQGILKSLVDGSGDKDALYAMAGFPTTN